jgi:hypothetical protein
MGKRLVYAGLLGLGVALIGIALLFQCLRNPDSHLRDQEAKVGFS